MTPLVGLDSQVPSVAIKPVVDDDDDEELDQLLGLQKPASEDTGHQLISGADKERGSPEKGFDAVKEVALEGTEEKTIEKNVTTQKSSSVKEVMTEEDLEDWLDSMIS